MRILVYGLGKTGTTAMAHAIHAALPDHELVLEPRSLASVDLTKPNLVVKSVRANGWQKELDELARFDRRLLVHRHPLDRIVSYVLYDPFNGRGFSDDENANRYYELIRRKSEDPDSVSMNEIVALLADITGNDVFVANAAHARSMLALDREHGATFHRLSYESFVDGERAELEAHLGFALPTQVDVRPNLQRVVRTKSHGDFHRWFLPSDLETPRPAMVNYAKRFGYSLELDPSVDRRVEPKTSYEYVARVINDYREHHGLPRFEPVRVRMREEGQLFDRALELFKADKLSDAEELLDRAAKMAPENVAILVRLAVVRLRLGKVEEAWQGAQRARDLEPGHPMLPDLIQRISARRRQQRRR